MIRILLSAVLLILSACFVCAQDAPQRRRCPRREAFQVDTPMVHDPVMAWENGTYYLYSEDTGSDKHILFRTSTDSNVGAGVMCCFVDGESLAARSYWTVALVEGETNVYTFQIPSNQKGYEAGQFWGIQPTHESNAASPTYGVYSDINYADYPSNCQWMLVPYDKQEQIIFQTALVLENLLAIGKSKRAEMTWEKAVYDNLESTLEDMQKACRKMRRKLNFINFENEQAWQIAVAYYDADHNGEIGYNEVSGVEDIGNEFQSSNITSLDELRYFTKAEYLAGNSFKDCKSLRSVTLPDGLLNIYYQAFQNDTKLEYVSAGSCLKYIGNNAFTGCQGLK